MKTLKRLLRLYAQITQPGTGGLIQPGDFRCRYTNGDKSRFMSYGDAKNLIEIHGGRVEWRHDEDHL